MFNSKKYKNLYEQEQSKNNQLKTVNVNLKKELEESDILIEKLTADLLKIGNIVNKINRKVRLNAIDEIREIINNVFPEDPSSSY